jgi:hypothetical protein
MISPRLSLSFSLINGAGRISYILQSRVRTGEELGVDIAFVLVSWLSARNQGINGKHGLLDEFLLPLPLGITAMIVLVEGRSHGYIIDGIFASLIIFQGHDDCNNLFCGAGPSSGLSVLNSENHARAPVQKPFGQPI